MLNFTREHVNSQLRNIMKKEKNVRLTTMVKSAG